MLTIASTSRRSRRHRGEGVRPVLRGRAPEVPTAATSRAGERAALWWRGRAGSGRQARSPAPAWTSGRPTGTASTTSSTTTTGWRPAPPVHRRAGPVRVLVRHAPRVPDPGRRTRGRPAEGRRPGPMRGRAPAHHGRRARVPPAGQRTSSPRDAYRTRTPSSGSSSQLISTSRSQPAGRGPRRPRGPTAPSGAPTSTSSSP